MKSITKLLGFGEGDEFNFDAYLDELIGEGKAFFGDEPEFANVEYEDLRTVSNWMSRATVLMHAIYGEGDTLRFFKGIPLQMSGYRVERTNMLLSLIHI